MTDYSDEIMSLLKDNAKLQQVGDNLPELDMQLVDWTKAETYQRVLDNQRIDMVIATDVIYKGSPYDYLSNLLLAIAQSPTEIMIIIPK